MRKRVVWTIIFPAAVSILFACAGSNAPASPSKEVAVGQYTFYFEGDPTIESITLPQQFTDANWGPLEDMCERAGYSMKPYAGESVERKKYSIMEKWYGANSSEPLYLWVLEKAQTTICGYLSVREGSNAAPGVFAINDPNVR